MHSPSVRAEPRTGAVGLLLFCLLSVLFTGVFPPYANPNELSRLLAVYSFVENGTFQIDGAVRVFGDIEDRSYSGGHEYSNKAPGLIFAAIPVYRAIRIFMSKPVTPLDPPFLLVRVLVVTPVCVLALALFRARLKARGLPAADLVTTALGFGTPFLFYARSFFSHAWVAALLFISFDLIGRAEAAGTRRRVGPLLWAAGVVAGWAAISEYPVAILVALLLVRAAYRGAFRRALMFAVGTLLPLALLLAYNAVCFGSPFVLSSAREGKPEFAALAGRGLFGIGAPSLTVAFEYLFHPARGLLLFSPFLAWAIAGFWKWRRTGDDRGDWGLCLAASAVFFLVMTGYPNWHGGWSLGDRYLLPILFFAACAIPYALRSPLSRWAFAAAAGFSVLTHAILTATWVHHPLNFVWPLSNAAIWFLVRGWAAGGALGDLPSWSWIAPLVSVLAAGTALLVAVLDAGLTRSRNVLAVAAAAAGVVLFAILPGGLDYTGRLHRAELYSVLSGRDPERRELWSVVREARTPDERRLAVRSWQRYGARRP